MKHTVLEAASYLSRHDRPFVLATILKTQGSTSRSQGSMIVDQEGEITGTIGGGELEAYALTQALDVLRENARYRHLQFSVQADEQHSQGVVYLFLLNCTTDSCKKAFMQLRAWEENELHHVLGIQMQPSVEILGYCEGGATVGNVHPTFLDQAKRVLESKLPVYVEGSSWTCHLSLPVNHHCLVLVGGGHVNQAIAHLAHFIGLPTQVLETRKQFATTELFPYARDLIVAPTLPEAFDKITTNSATACVIASHAFDPVLATLLLQRDLAYLGVLGSRHKAKTLLQSLNLPRETEKRLFSPIGLDLGTETPQEIAVAVIAEIMKVFNSRSGASLKNQAKQLVVVRGGGDLATGVILRLHRAGYRVIVLEIEKPSVIRCTVSVAQAMFDQALEIEGVLSRKADNLDEAFRYLEEGIIPVLNDPEGKTIKEINPVCVVDGIMAKRNLGTTITDAPLVLALGPGFEAGKDCDAVIETMRGHSLARIIRSGSALPNTAVPGLTEGYGKERVLHSPAAGVFHSDRTIGELVKQGDVLAMVGDTPVIATIDGKLRGLLNNGLTIPEHFKIADIDPRGVRADHTTVSEKAMAIGGAALEALDAFISRM